MDEGKIAKNVWWITHGVLEKSCVMCFNFIIPPEVLYRINTTVAVSIQPLCLGLNMIWTDQVVDDIGKGPDERHSEEGNAEQDDVQHDGQQQVGEPYSSAVHHPRVGVHLAVSYAHIHPEHTKRGRQNVSVQDTEKHKGVLTQEAPTDLLIHRDSRYPASQTWY